GVAVEHVDHRHLADADGDAGDVHFPRELVRPILELLLLAAKAEGVTHEHARDVHARPWEAGFLRLAIRVAAQAERVADPRALHGLGVDVELGAGRKAHADERGRAHGVFQLPESGETVLALVRRAERRIALLDERGLAMYVPIDAEH